MLKSRVSAFGAVAVAAAVLAGCQSAPRGVPAPGPIAAAPQTGIEGAWLDQAGTGLTTFTAGRFETVATDSAQKLSEGTYVMRSATLVEITGISIIRQSPIAFNCAMATPNQLNCTASSGQQFVLTRRVGTV
jgi:hypothetical protein